MLQNNDFVKWKRKKTERNHAYAYIMWHEIEPVGEKHSNPIQKVQSKHVALEEDFVNEPHFIATLTDTKTYILNMKQ